MQEMLGLAIFMAGGPPGEVAGHFREAFSRYDALAARGNAEMRRFATRSQLLLAEVCCHCGLHADANAALMRAQGQVLPEDPGHARSFSPPASFPKIANGSSAASGRSASLS